MPKCHCCKKETGKTGTGENVCSDCISRGASIERKCSLHPHKKSKKLILKDTDLIEMADNNSIIVPVEYWFGQIEVRLSKSAMELIKGRKSER